MNHLFTNPFHKKTPYFFITILFLFIAYGKTFSQDTSSTKEKNVEPLLWKNVKNEFDNKIRSFKTDTEKVIWLRNKVYAMGLWGTINNNKEITQTKIRYWEMDLEEMYDILAKNEYTVKCGFLGHLLARLYNRYGFEAYLYDCGEFDGVSHLVTIVKMAYEKDTIYSLQDPTNNIMYTDSVGKTIDFFVLLKKIKNNQISDIAFQKNELENYTRLVLPNNDALRSVILTKIKKSFPNQSFEPIESSNPDLEFVTQFNFEYSLTQSDVFNKETFDWLKDKDQPQNLLYLFLFKLSMLPSHGHRESQLHLHIPLQKWLDVMEQ